MLKFTIQSEVFRGAQEFQAGNREFRYYLKGVFIRKDGMVCGTDGISLFVSSATFIDEDGQALDKSPLSDDLIIKLHGKAPKGYGSMIITVVDESTTSPVLAEFESAFATSLKAKPKKIIGGELIDGKYPEIERIVPKYHRRKAEGLAHNNTMIYQAHLMARVSKVFGDNGFDGVFVTHSDPNSTIVVEPFCGDWPDGTKVLIMPCRPPIED